MPIPVSREFMLTLKAKKDEEKRIEKVKNCVNRIYHEAIRAAEATTTTSYSLDINPMRYTTMPHINDQRAAEYQFYKDNMEEILSGLQTLFQGCIVKLTKMCSGNDGKRYDISAMDEKMLPFINQKNAFECIVIDWS